MRFHGATWASVYIPAQPGLIRPNSLTSVISVNNNPAPPMARLPRCTMCQSLGMPPSAMYWHMGDTTTRFCNTISRSRNGVNMGG
jgi:hypothetical protein